MKTVSEETHNTFINNVNNEPFMEKVKTKQSLFLNGITNGMINTNDKLSKDFAMWLLDQMNDYYMIPLSQGFFQLISKDEKSTMVVGLLTPNKYTSRYLKYAPKTIELANIHSLKKGEGKKMMQRLISISKELNVPISLWAETDKNVKYFSKYGFKSSGKIGVNKEHFMILETWEKTAI